MSLLDSVTPLPDSPAGSSRSRRYHFSTLCATVENPEQKDQYNASSIPIYQSATFKGLDGPYDYTRSGNPTRSHLEHHLAKISSARHAFVVSSGMAALDVITRILKPGDEVIAGDDLYGGTNRLLVYLKVHTGVIVHHVDTTDTKAIIPSLSSKTAMVLLESPTNPLLKIADLAQIVRDVREFAPNAIVVVDNTMMSPYLQRPLEHGADLVYDSGTKYLSGHHDLMAGVITCNRDDLAKHIARVINSVGNALSPFDSFLLLRGIKTLAIRLDRQQATAMRVASYLHALGFTTYYPGLPDHPRREIHERLANGSGAVLSFITGDKEVSERIVGATRLWGISVSFGAVNSLISMPCLMSHASIDPAVRAARGLPEDLIRLCVGIEEADDLIEDLEFALLEAGAITPVPHPENGVAFMRSKDLSEFGGLVGSALEKLTNHMDGLGINASVEHSLSSSSEEGQSPAIGEFMVSAPGKVILFGEHAVVYGVTAIAASVDLRCYGRITPRRDGKLLLSLPDLNNFEHVWDVDKGLPWSHTASTSTDSGGAHPDALNIGLIEAIERHGVPSGLTDADPNKALRGAIVAFLYLYISLSTNGYRPCFTLTIRSALPIGAGLGSSAAYSVCVATSLLLLYNRISYPSPHFPPPGSSASSPGALKTELSDTVPSSLLPAFADEVNSWAFISEKILHGNPSGVDNSVATYGGALAFTRNGEIRTRKAGMETISGFKSINFLLTDSKVPRDTKSLVASVGSLKQTEPELVLRILRSIQSISDQAETLLGTDSVSLSRSALLSSLGKLIDENHALLASLKVSHPSLEVIRAVTAADPFNLHTKLTGAGGGGCAVTLLPDDFKNSSGSSNLLDAIRKAGFVPYSTSVGGKGVGIVPSPSISEHTFVSTSVEKLVEAVAIHKGWFFV